MKTHASEVITIKEDFMQVGTKEMDSKHRISLGGRLRKLLGSKMKIDSFEVFLGKDGDVLLRPSANIPSKELWIYKDPAVYEKIKQGLRQAKEGRVQKAADLDKFFEAL